MKKANREALKIPERLDHRLTPFAQYGDKGGLAMKTIDRLIFAFPFLFFLAIGCAAPLANPTGPNSSLVIGKLGVHIQYPASAFFILPRGTIYNGIEVTIAVRDKKQTFSATTERGGYFLIPNVPPGTYHFTEVFFLGAPIIFGDSPSATITFRGEGHSFLVPPGVIVNIGTITFEVLEKSRIRSRRSPLSDKEAQSRIAKMNPNTPWLKRKYYP